MKKIPLWMWGAAAVGGLWYLSRPKTTTGAAGTVAAGASSATGSTNAGHIAGAPHLGFRGPGHQYGAGRPHGGGHGHGRGGHSHGRGGVPWGGFAGVDYGTDVYIANCGCSDLPALQQSCTRAPGKL